MDYTKPASKKRPKLKKAGTYHMEWSGNNSLPYENPSFGWKKVLNNIHTPQNKLAVEVSINAICKSLSAITNKIIKIVETDKFHLKYFISKLTKQSNFFGNFFSKLNTDFFVDYDLPTLGKSHTPNRGLLTRICLFESKNNDKFKGRNTRALPKPYWDLSYIYQELWGLRCEQSPDTTCECDTPIYYNVETQGGQ